MTVYLRVCYLLDVSYTVCRSGQGITTIFLSSYNKSSIISIEAQTFNGSIANQTHDATVIYCQSHPVTSVLNQSFTCDPMNSFFTFTSIKYFLLIQNTVHKILVKWII